MYNVACADPEHFAGSQDAVVPQDAEQRAVVAPPGGQHTSDGHEFCHGKRPRARWELVAPPRAEKAPGPMHATMQDGDEVLEAAEGVADDNPGKAFLPSMVHKVAQDQVEIIAPRRQRRWAGVTAGTTKVEGSARYASPPTLGASLTP